MGIVQGAGNGGNDRRSLRCRHPGRETLAHQVRSIHAIDILRGDPQLPLELTRS
jgi:hypothetical protein